MVREFAAPGAGFTLDVHTASRPSAVRTALRISVISPNAFNRSSVSYSCPKFAARLIW
jgi:hypothetical protein